MPGYLGLVFLGEVGDADSKTVQEEELFVVVGHINDVELFLPKELFVNETANDRLQGVGQFDQLHIGAVLIDLDLISKIDSQNGLLVLQLDQFSAIDEAKECKSIILDLAHHPEIVWVDEIELVVVVKVILVDAVDDQ